MAVNAVVGVIKVVGIALSAKSMVEGLKEGNLFQAVVGAVGAYYGVSSLASGAAGAGASATADGAAQATATAGANTADTVASEIAKKGAKSAVEAGAKSAAKEAVGQSLEAAAKEAATETVGSSLLGDLSTSAIEVGNNAPAGLIGQKMGETAATSAIDKAVAAGNTFTSAGAASSAGGGASSAIDKAVASGNTIEAPTFMDKVAEGAGKLKGIIDSGMKPIGDALNVDGTTIQKGLDFFNENPVVAQAGMQLAGSYLQAKGEEELMDRQERLYAEKRQRVGTPGDISRAAGIQWDPQTRRFVQTVT